MYRNVQKITLKSSHQNQLKYCTFSPTLCFQTGDFTVPTNIKGPMTIFTSFDLEVGQESVVALCLYKTTLKAVTAK